MENRAIEQIADNVLTKYAEQGGVHKVFNEIMTAEGIKFRKLNSLNDDFVGALTKYTDGQLYIIVNSSIDNDGRMNFTIAHELGHYFLEHQLKQNSFYCSSAEIVEKDIRKNPIEQEANYFASCLLMPEQRITSAFLAMLANSKKAKTKDYLHVTNDGTYSVWRGISDELMKCYGVSETALRYRLQKFGVAKFEFAPR